MKKWFYQGCALALALLLAGCSVISSEDGPTDIHIGSNTISIGGDEDPIPEADDPLDDTLDDLPTEEEAGSPPEIPDDPGTTAGEEDLPYEDGLPEDALDEDGTYNSAEDVSLYLYTFGHLPENYITKNEARDLGWSGGSVEKVAPGCAIGGDRFGNREGILPEGSYHECDIDTIGESSRGAKRLVYSDDGRIYYTEDHYETFTLLYGEE